MNSLTLAEASLLEAAYFSSETILAWRYSFFMSRVVIQGQLLIGYWGNGGLHIGRVYICEPVYFE